MSDCLLAVEVSPAPRTVLLSGFKERLSAMRAEKNRRWCVFRFSLPLIVASACAPPEQWWEKQEDEERESGDEQPEGNHKPS